MELFESKTGRKCAVKQMLADEDDSGTDHSRFDMGHPDFENPVSRTQHIGVVHSAFFGTHFGDQVMELGDGTGLAASTISFGHFHQFQNHALTAVQNLLRNNLCYLDFKLENVIYGNNDTHSRQFRVADADSIGGINFDRNIQQVSIRAATFPFMHNQKMFGFPVCDVI